MKKLTDDDLYETLLYLKLTTTNICLYHQLTGALRELTRLMQLADDKLLTYQRWVCQSLITEYAESIANESERT